MALELYIHPCIHKPPHRLHPPPADKPLRIRIQGPLEPIQKLFPNVSWHEIVPFPQPGGLELASLTHQTLYGQEGLNMADGALMVRDEYLAWVMEGRRPLDRIDYYGITFDHIVPADDPDPEVLAIDIIEVDNDGGVYADGGKYANDVLLFSVNPTDYTEESTRRAKMLSAQERYAGSQANKWHGSREIARSGDVRKGDAVCNNGHTHSYIIDETFTARHNNDGHDMTSRGMPKAGLYLYLPICTTITPKVQRRPTLY